jgi:branched-chain amino acid transport system substrate-binding protein
MMLNGSKAIADRNVTTRRHLLKGLGGAVLGAAIVSEFGPGAKAAGGEPVRIGSSVPLTGFAAGDGEDMMRGYELAVSQINEMGGIFGRPLELVTLDAGLFAPDVMVNNFKRLINEFKIDAYIGGYQLNTGPEFDIIAEAGMLYYHNNTVEVNAELVRNNPEKYWMVFQHDPTEKWYSLSLPGFLDSFERVGGWKPINNKIAIVNANNSYSAGLTKALRDSIGKTRWQIGLVEEIVAPLTEWGPTLAKLRADPHAVIWVTDYFPGDLAAFTKQFALDPTPSLLHQQYGPSVPEYLDLTGSVANGVTWASVIGTLPDKFGQAYADAYRAKFNEEPGFTQGSAVYDAVHIYWQAACLSGGDVANRRKIAAQTKRFPWRGVQGSRMFDQPDQTAVSYPDFTGDASMGLPTLYVQIQDGKQQIVSPDPFAGGSFQIPPWIKQ